MDIASLSLKRPVSAVMLFVSLMVIGAIAAFRLPLEFFPPGGTERFSRIRLHRRSRKPVRNQRRSRLHVELQPPGVASAKRLDRRQLRARQVLRARGQLERIGVPVEHVSVGERADQGV